MKLKTLITIFIFSFATPFSLHAATPHNYIIRAMTCSMNWWNGSNFATDGVLSGSSFSGQIVNTEDLTWPTYSAARINCDVKLPDNATITDLEVSGTDLWLETGYLLNMQFWLTRVPRTNPNDYWTIIWAETNYCNFGSTIWNRCNIGTCDHCVAVDFPLVDNLNYVYFIEAFMTDVPTSDLLSLYNFKVKYTLP